MIENNKSKGFISILTDKRFVEWKLFQTDEAADFWRKYLESNPHEHENFQLAEQYFEKVNLSSFEISTEKKEKAVVDLEIAVNKYRRKKYRSLFSAAAAACVAAVVIVLVFLQPDSGTDKGGYIVGSELQSEDIQLIAGSESRAFQSNIDIEINLEGAVQVKAKDQEEENIVVDHGIINKLIVPYGKRSTVTLADGSKVWLNSGTVLEFPTQFAGRNREIFLSSGEIYIEVAPDTQKSFFVNTTAMSIKVYGTKFNVSAYADVPQSVVLVEGSVALKSNQIKALFLEPNQKASLKGNGLFTTQDVDVNEFVSWKNGYLLFDETPMPEVLSQIERYYNLSFNYDKDVSLKGLTCTGRIVLSEDLDMVMTTISLITSTEYKRENNKIYMSSKPN